MDYGCDGRYKYRVEGDWSREEREVEVEEFGGSEGGDGVGVVGSEEWEWIVEVVVE